MSPGIPFSPTTQILSQSRTKLHLSASSSVTAAPAFVEVQTDKFLSAPIALSRIRPIAQNGEATDMLDDSSEATFCGTISLAEIYLEFDEVVDNRDPLGEERDQRRYNYDPVRQLKSAAMVMLNPHATKEYDVAKHEAPPMRAASNERTHGMLDSFFSIEAVMAALEMFSACNLPGGMTSSLCCDKPVAVGDHSSKDASMQQENVRLDPSPLPQNNAYNAKVNCGVAKDLPSPASPDSPSLVNTETTTTTTLSGTSVPSIIYISQRSIVTRDEPLEMPFGVITTPMGQKNKKFKTTLFQRLGVTMRHKKEGRRMKHKEMFERVQI